MQLLMQKGNADSPVYGTPVESQLPAQQMTQPNPILSISDETYQKLKRVIDSNIEKPFINRGKPIPYEETRLKLNAIIRMVGEALNSPVDVESVRTPQELADGIASYYESRGAAKVDAVCADVSLLTNEIIKRYMGADSSILIFHLVDKDGAEYVHGHTTAAISVKGWLVDPALQSEAIPFDHIVLDRNEKDYGKFYDELKKKYSPDSGSSIFLNCVFVEFSQAKSDSELKAFYLMEKAARLNEKLKKPGTSEDEKRQMQDEENRCVLEAYSLAPGNYYAAISAGDIYKTAGDIASARRAYLSAAANNANLYLANSLPAWKIFNLQNPSSAEDLAVSYKMIHTALDAAKKEGRDLTFAYLYQSKIADKLGYTEEAEDAYQRYEKCSEGR
jgi:hypothetical protein